MQYNMINQPSILDWNAFSMWREDALCQYGFGTTVVRYCYLVTIAYSSLFFDFSLNNRRSTHKFQYRFRPISSMSAQLSTLHQKYVPLKTILKLQDSKKIPCSYSNPSGSGFLKMVRLRRTAGLWQVSSWTL